MADSTESEFFAAALRRALASLSPRTAETITDFSQQCAAIQGKLPAEYVGVLIQMHARVWADFCNALALAYVAEIQNHCPVCRQETKGGTCPTCQPLPQ